MDARKAAAVQHFSEMVCLRVLQCRIPPWIWLGNYKVWFGFKSGIAVFILMAQIIYARAELGLQALGSYLYVCMVPLATWTTVHQGPNPKPTAVSGINLILLPLEIADKTIIDFNRTRKENWDTRNKLPACLLQSCPFVGVVVVKQSIWSGF